MVIWKNIPGQVEESIMARMMVTTKMTTSTKSVHTTRLVRLPLQEGPRICKLLQCRHIVEKIAILPDVQKDVYPVEDDVWNLVEATVYTCRKNGKKYFIYLRRESDVMQKVCCVVRRPLRPAAGVRGRQFVVDKVLKKREET